MSGRDHMRRFGMTSRLKRQRPVAARDHGLRSVERSSSEVPPPGDEDVESLHHEPVVDTMTSPPHTETPIGQDTVDVREQGF